MEKIAIVICLLFGMLLNPIVTPNSNVNCVLVECG